MNEFYVMGWLCNIDSLISNWQRNSLPKWYAEPRPIFADYSLVHLTYCSLSRRRMALVWQDGFKVLCYIQRPQGCRIYELRAKAT